MLERRPAAIAFDCYGTLLDVTDDSFIHACGELLRQFEIEHDHNEFWKSWLASSRTIAEEQGRVTGKPLEGPEPDFFSFRERWPDVFDRTFQGLGVSADTVAAYQVFHSTLAEAVAYPDTAPALERLRSHFRLCVVSNADDDHLHEALAANGLNPFEFILSSEAARSYKPRTPIFREAATRLGLEPAQILYVGDSPLADVLGARHAGMSVAWINRLGATRPESIPEPDTEITTLMELADQLLALPPAALER
ncbi:MAG: HAD family hydrolase [Gemmataceae bacterium]|nr:HAD family hydrolase [Gemmataceae bacterium]